MEEYKLVVESIFKIKNKASFFKKQKFPVQNDSFDIGIIIRNIGDNIFPGGKLKGLTIRSSENKQIYEAIDKEFSVPAINPNESKDVWMGKMSTYLSGLVWINGVILPENTTTHKITTYQKERGTNQSVNPQTNIWGNSYFIQSSAEVESSRTNFLILVLTLLIFIDATLGLKNIFLFVLHNIGKLFSFFGALLSKIPS